MNSFSYMAAAYIIIFIAIIVYSIGLSFRARKIQSQINFYQKKHDQD
jgi:hypothetical protein